jgi:hypothetical protein
LCSSGASHHIICSQVIWSYKNWKEDEKSDFCEKESFLPHHPFIHSLLSFSNSPVQVSLPLSAILDESLHIIFCFHSGICHHNFPVENDVNKDAVSNVGSSLNSPNLNFKVSNADSAGSPTHHFASLPSSDDAFAYSFFMLHSMSGLLRPDSSHYTTTFSSLSSLTSSYDLHIFPGPPPMSQTPPSNFSLGFFFSLVLI